MRLAKRKNRSASGSGNSKPPREKLFEASERLAQAETFRRAGEFRKAKRICEDLLKRHPRYVGALHTLGQTHLDAEEFDQAFEPLSRAQALAQDNWQVLTALGRVKANLGMTKSAISDLERAYELGGAQPPIKLTLANLYWTNGDVDKSIEFYKEILAMGEPDPQFRLALADSLKEVGLYDDAKRICRGLIDEGIVTPEVAFTLATVPGGTDVTDLLSYTQFMVSDDLDEMTRLRTIRAVALHAADRHEEAWDEFLEAKRMELKTVGPLWDPNAPSQKMITHQADAMPHYKERGRLNQNEPVSLFLVGESRSGKTTIERLCTALDGLVAGYENTLLYDCVMTTLARARCISVPMASDLPAELEADFRDVYSAALTDAAAGGHVVTSTSPKVVEDIPWIRRVIPGARFIFVRRNRQDQMFRMISTSYAKGTDVSRYSTDLSQISKRLDWYDHLIDIYSSRMPHDCLVFSYEDIIENPDLQLDRIAELVDIKNRTGEAPELGDDRGVSRPYRKLIEAELQKLSED